MPSFRFAADLCHSRRPCVWRRRSTGAVVDSPEVDIGHFEFGKATRFTERFDGLVFARAGGAA